MLGAAVDVQAGQRILGDDVAGQHTADGQLHGQLGLLLHQQAVLGLLEAADPAGVAAVVLLLQLLAGQNSLLGVDDHDEVAAVGVGGELRLVLAAQQGGRSGGSLAQGLARRIEDIPLADDVPLVGHKSGHGETSNFAFYDQKCLNRIRTPIWTTGAFCIIIRWFQGVNTFFQNFNLEINKGEIVGIVGNNGVGKSTLIKIIMKMIPIDIGQIIVNGKYELEDIDEEYLYKNISVVPQSTVILSGKLRDILNPTKRDISDNKIIETLKKFTVDYSIFENDLNYEILEKGGNMSGGEAQKLSLVRMVLENKPWVLLDEPTSAMDVECEKIICSILKEYLKKRTAVIITHRPEILSICDKIIRLES